MKTLQDEWKHYRDSCYPTGTTAVQNQECHQAFFAGASVILGLMDELGTLPPKAAVELLQRLCVETATMLEARADTLRNFRIKN